MTRYTPIISALGMGILTFLSATNLLAGIVHVEDFASSQYKDAANTTAWWDTSGQRLGLHPFEPSLVGGKDTPGYSRDLFVNGDYVYLVDGDYGLQVFDVTDPANPDSIANYNTSGFSSDVFVSGKHAFIADGLSGLQVIDISDPSQPVRVGGYDTPGYARGVSVEGDYAYVAEGDPLGQANLRVFNISDPTNPGLAATLPVAGLAIGTFVHGDYLYLAGGPGGLHIISISNPRAPTHVATFPTATYARNVVVASGRAYLATAESGLTIVDINDPANPVHISTENTPDYAFGVAVVGSRVYVADDETGLMEFEVTSSGVPILKSTVDTPAKAISVAVSGCYAYVADGPSSLRVVRVSEPFGPLPLATSHDMYKVLSVANQGHYDYVLSRDAFGIFDMSIPRAPLFLNGRAFEAYAGDIAIAGHHAFVTVGGTTNLAVFDVTRGEPSVPAIFPTGAPANGVAVAGDYAFVANGRTLTVVDITNPMAPALVNRLTLPEWSSGIELAGNYLFLTTSDSGVFVVDITIPSAPVALWGAGAVGRDIAISGSHAFVAGANGLEVFDIKDPKKLSLVGSLGTTGEAWNVAVDGNIALVGGTFDYSYSVIDMIDITDPTAPTIAASHDAGSVRCITGDYASLAANLGGLKTVGIRQRLFELTRNVAQSVDLYAGENDIIRIRLSTVQTDSVRWEVTADGANWIGVQPTATWTTINPTGTDLRWRSTSHYTDAIGQQGPVCERVQIEWLHHHAVIDSIVDVPDDDGDWVNVHFTRSGHDFSGDPTAVTRYVVYRESRGTAALRSFAADSLPPGHWEAVDSVEAWGLDHYSMKVPAHSTSGSGASTEYSVYVIAAEAQPSHVFYSPPDSGYSVKNTPPDPPAEFALYQNIPNPFNSRTTIVCDIPADGPVSLQIYDVRGRLVRTLVNGPRIAGQLTVPWDGKDNRGQLVASGVYFYRLQAAGLTQSRKMTFVE